MIQELVNESLDRINEHKLNTHRKTVDDLVRKILALDNILEVTKADRKDLVRKLVELGDAKQFELQLED